MSQGQTLGHDARRGPRVIPLAWDGDRGARARDGSKVVVATRESPGSRPTRGRSARAISSSRSTPGSSTSAAARARGAATLVPDDQEAALAALASLVRSKSAARVVAVVGSAGKTSTKDILGALCAPHAADDLGGQEPEQRDRAAAHRLPARARHRDPRHRDGHARARPDRRALRDRATGRRRRPAHRPRAPRAPRHRRARRRGERRGRSRRFRRAAPRSSRAASPELEPFLEPRRHRAPPLRSRGRRARERPRSLPGRRAGRRARAPVHPAPPRRQHARRAPRLCRARAPARARLRRSAPRSGSPPGAERRSRLPGGGFVVNDAYNANPDSMRAALVHLAERAGSAAARRRSSARWPSSATRRSATTRRSASSLAELEIEVIGVGEPARDVRAGRVGARTSRARSKPREPSSAPATPCSSRPRAPSGSKASPTRSRRSPEHGPSPDRRPPGDGRRRRHRAEVHRDAARAEPRPADPSRRSGGAHREAGNADDGRPPHRGLRRPSVPRALAVHGRGAHRALHHARLRGDRFHRRLPQAPPGPLARAAGALEDGAPRRRHGRRRAPAPGDRVLHDVHLRARSPVGPSTSGRSSTRFSFS